MQKTVTIIGGGPAALMLAAHLDPKQFKTTIYEQNKSLGRKFLVAGKGGFNLTHSEPIADFITRYTPSSFLKNALLAFDNTALREWFDNISIPTYVGTSKRVYPEEGIKPIDVLNAILKKLKAQEVKIKYLHTWKGWSNEGALLFNKDTQVKSDIVVFALGGGSWKVTGSTGKWPADFKAKGIPTVPFEPANCAHQVEWDENFIAKHEGTPLKNIAMQCLSKRQRGEAVITQFGLEGNAIYALSPEIREGLNKNQKATITIDFKPTLTEEQVFTKLKKSKLRNTTEVLRKTLNLTEAQVDLLKINTSKEVYINPKLLAHSIKNLAVTVMGRAELNEAISTTGGLPLTALNENFELTALPNTYCIGEMLAWDAPTGGYLLQACFSMGAYLGKRLNG